MSMQTGYPFIRYLAAKKTVDDRALNAGVWARLGAELRLSTGSHRMEVLEVGAGIGTMVERALERRLFPSNVRYTLLDDQPANLAEARRRLPDWANRHGWNADQSADGLELSTGIQTVKLIFVQADALAYAQQDLPPADLLMAHAFLDLVHLPTALPMLLSTLRPGGLFAFTLNFDGVTALEPPIDPALDSQIEALYHADMDTRMVKGQPSGNSHTGRHLFRACQATGADILAAGSSDWVVFPSRGEYPNDEAYFLHAIIQFIDEALQGHPDLDGEAFARWVQQRHDQVNIGELVYVAHQLDLLGRRSG